VGKHFPISLRPIFTFPYVPFFLFPYIPFSLQLGLSIEMLLFGIGQQSTTHLTHYRGLNLVAFLCFDGFGFSKFCLTRFGLDLIKLFWTSQLLVQFRYCRLLHWKVWFSGGSQIRHECLLCLFWALTMTRETSSLSYVLCHQSYRSSLTLNWSSPFSWSLLLYIP